MVRKGVMRIRESQLGKGIKLGKPWAQDCSKRAERLDGKVCEGGV